MPPDYSVVDVSPSEWHRLFTPIGALWLAALGAALAARGVRWADPAGPWTAIAGLAALVVLAWLAAGLITLSLGWAVEHMWLHRWPWLGAPLTRRRQRRWAALHRGIATATATGDASTARRRMRRRNAIAVATPECPTWMADRWAALESRVANAYGLDVRATWPRLWLTLPDPVRGELRLAAAQWLRSSVWFAWAVLYALLGFLWWPAFLVAAVLAAWAWARARVLLAYRADLIEATFDTYGPHLAAAMGVIATSPGPLTPATGDDVTARTNKGL